MRLRSLVALLAVVGVASACVPVDPPPGPGNPRLSIATAVSGLTNPWDVAWAPDGTMLFTQRGSGLYAALPGGVVRLTDGGPDRWISGETGIMGLAVDPNFATNRRVFTCQGTTDNGLTVQVVGWQIASDWSTATRVNDPLIGWIDGTSGRHGGCRLEYGADQKLYVTTGDAAVGTYPQRLDSINGKVLRIDPVTGTPPADNPAARRPGMHPLIYTYGHRNPQGLALRSNGQMWTSEHGTDRDDEVNLLAPGTNYGWNPVPGYNESRPMTDLSLPFVQGAKWSSGYPTVATSGMTFLSGTQWGTWNGALAVATLKASKLLLQFYDRNGMFIEQRIPAELNGTLGRLRTAQQGPDGCLYLATDNGGGTDRIVRVCPG